MKNKVTFTFGFFYLLFTLVCGQGVARTSTNNLVLGVNLTGTGYYGDINYNQSGVAKTFNVLPGLEANISKSNKGYFSPLGRFGYGRIVAQNSDLKPFYFGPTTDPNSYYEPPRYVRTDFVYLDGAVKASPFKDLDYLLKPYASLGLGGMLFFPFKNDTIPFKGFNPLRGEKFSTITASVPFGLGTEVNLSPKVNLNLGTTLRIPMNDYMDLYGANLIPNRKKGSDMLFSFAIGANFNLNTPEPVPTNSPRYYIPPTQDALPLDTTILASADPNIMAIILRQDPDYLAAKDYTLTTGYPEGMIPLAVLAQSLECDSIARLYDQRISSLYNENLQLRSQYKKLNFELEQALAEGNNGGGGDNAKTDSLIRVIYNKENKVKDLEKQIAEMSPASPIQSLGESEKIAEYQKEIIALKQEVADLKSGTTGENETIGFTELQEKYSKLEEEKRNLDDQYAATQSQNAMMRKEIEDLRKNPSSDGGPDLQAKVDSLIEENQRLVTDYEAMKREFLVLRQDYDDLKASASDVASLRTQLNTLQAQNSEYLAQTEILKKENEELKSQNLADIKSKLDQATVYVDTMNVRYTRLQTVIENYESMLADAKRQNDDLELQVKQLQAASPSGGEADSIRTASLMAEIEELNMELTAERQQKKQFENDLNVANNRNTELETENKTLKEGELDIAMSRIAVLEKENQELKSLNSMTDNQNDTLHQDSVLASALYSQIEGLKKDREELMTKNQELVRRMEINSATGSEVDTAQWVSRVSIVNREKDSLQRVIDAFQTEQPEGSEQLLALQRENLQLKNEGARMMEVLEENKTAFAPIREKLSALETENAALGNEKQALLTEVSDLKSTNETLEKKVAEVSNASVVEQALADTRTELDNVKREKENLSVERERIISENSELKIAVDSLTSIAANTPLPSGVDSIQANGYLAQISTLKVQQDSLQRVIDAFSTESPDEQLTALQRENLQLKNENARMLEVLEGNKDSFGPVREELARLKDENIALSAEKSRLEQELALKSGTISCEELGLQVQQLEAENNLMRQQLAKSVVMQTQIVETQDLLVQKDITIANLQQKLTEVTVNSDVQEVVAVKDEEITTLTNQRNALQNKVSEIEKRLLVTENELNVALEKGGNPQLQAQVDVLISERDLYKKQYEDAIASTTSPNPVVSPDVEKYVAQIESLQNQNEQLTNENAKLREGVSLPVENPDASALLTQNQELTSEVSRLNGLLSAKAEGNDGQMVTELNQQVSELTTENDNLRNQLKIQTSLTSGNVSEKDEMILSLNSKVSEKEDEMLGLRSQNNILVEERDRWKKLYDDASTSSGTQPVVSTDDKDEQMLILKNQIAALTDENNKLKSVESMPENEQLVALQQEVRVLTNRNEQLENQINDIQPAVENLMAENTSLKKEMQTIKEGGAGSPKPEGEQNKQIVTLKKKLADAEEEIRNLMASKGEDLLVMYKEENDLFKQRINELQDENSNLKTQLENSGDGEIAILMQEKLEMKEANKALKAEVEQLRNQPSSSGKEELIASLRGRIEAQDNEIQRLNDKIKNSSIPVSSETSEYTKAEEADALRKQNQELFDENESLRTALSNALNALYSAQSATVGVGNTAEYDRLKSNYEQLVAEKTVLESQVVNLTEKLKTNMGASGDADHDMLVAQNSQLLDENTALKQRLNAINENPSSGNPVASEEMELLRKQNSDLNEEVIALQSNVTRLSEEVETYKSINVSSGGDPEIAKLMTENATLKAQIEKNTEFVSNSIDQHNKDLNRIAELEEKVNNIPVVNVDTENYDEKIAALKSENQNLKNQLAIMEQKGKNQPIASNTTPSLNESALARRIAEVDARERRITQREEYIELKEEQLTLEDAKIKASAAREVELRLLEQDLKGFWDYQSDVMVDGSPCFPVSAFISKEEVMNRINSYFSAQGYKYQIVEGKMVYSNVIIPEIDPAKPINIALYMMISSENNSKKVLQGSFQYAGDRTYITSDKYPTQSIRAVKLLQKVAQ